VRVPQREPTPLRAGPKKGIPPLAPCSALLRVRCGLWRDIRSCCLSILFLSSSSYCCLLPLVFQIDVKKAFLNGNLKRISLYATTSWLCHLQNKVCHLHRVLYELKQALGAWFAKFSTNISSLWYSNSLYD